MPTIDERLDRPSPSPYRRLLRATAAAAVALVCLVGVSACHKEQPVNPSTPSESQSQSPAESPSGPGPSDCDVQPGDVSVLKGGTFAVDSGATIRAGLQYEVSRNPRTWKVMFLADGASTTRDVKRGDTVSVAGQTITVRDACADKVVLSLRGQAGAKSGSTSTG